jgi:hypothetical protein
MVHSNKAPSTGKASGTQLETALAEPVARNWKVLEKTLAKPVAHFEGNTKSTTFRPSFSSGKIGLFPLK